MPKASLLRSSWYGSVTIFAMMQLPESLDLNDGICRYAPCGECTLVEAVALVTSAIAYCRIRGVAKLFVDVSGFVGVSIPTLLDRFLMAEEWAQTGKGGVVMAVVARPEYIHPRKFGVGVAADLGMVVDVFTSERDALKWLSSATRRKDAIGILAVGTEKDRP